MDRLLELADELITEHQGRQQNAWQRLDEIKAQLETEEFLRPRVVMELSADEQPVMYLHAEMPGIKSIAKSQLALENDAFKAALLTEREFAQFCANERTKLNQLQG